MSIIDPRVDLADAYKRGADMEQKFIANLAQYLGTFLKENATIIEVLDDSDANSELKQAHQMVSFFCILELFSLFNDFFLELKIV